ncbi:hypothetical protein K438DRAFT_159963 [Mycena galopus ATCC 62051]|nr:hypothetical protein K438DRAFT_159963 [Mycena galopus ATCC 62051]
MEKYGALHSWTTLDVGSLPSRWKAPGEMEEIVAAWFSRAGALPLSLSYSGALERRSEQINTIISRHASRLQSLDLVIHSGIMLRLQFLLRRRCQPSGTRRNCGVWSWKACHHRLWLFI